MVTVLCQVIHVHLLFQVEEKNPSDVIRDLKTFTSKSLLKQIAENSQESHKEWLLWMFRRAAKNYWQAVDPVLDIDVLS